MAPENVTDAWFKERFGPEGETCPERETVPEKPLMLVIVIVADPEDPWVMFKPVGLELMPKSGTEGVLIDTEIMVVWESVPLVAVTETV